VSQSGDPLSDFRNFLYVTWKYLRLPAPTELQYDIADWIQNGPDRAGVEGFRGVAKSWIAATYALFELRRNPQLNILVVSGTGAKAEEFTTFCLQLLEAPYLQHLKPRPDQRQSRFGFDVNGAEPDQNPSMKSIGITGQLQGFRADLIIPDDVEITANSLTQLQREKLRMYVKEFEAILKPGGRIVYLGTPQTEDSLYNWLQTPKDLDVPAYQFRIWPVLYPDENERQEYGPRLSPLVLDKVTKDPKLVGQSTEPGRFSLTDIAKRRATYGRAGFNLQFMLRTRFADAEKYPLKLSDLVVTSLDMEQVPIRYVWASNPDRVISDLPNVGLAGDRLYEAIVPVEFKTQQPVYQPYDETIIAIDPSGRGADEAGVAILSSKHSYVFLRKILGFRDGYGPKTMEAIANLAKQYKANRVIIEENFGDGMYSALLTPYLTRIYPVTIEEVKHSMQKEKRIIDTLEPVISNHRMVVDRRVIQEDVDNTMGYPGEVAHQYQLFYQMTRITRERGSLVRDDRLDAVTIGVGYFTSRLRQDVESAAKATEERLFDEELRKFITQATGGEQEQDLVFSRPL
jgi:hypothetical protein